MVFEINIVRKTIECYLEHFLQKGIISYPSFNVSITYQTLINM